MRSNAHSYRNDTGAVVAAELHPADEGDTTTLSKTLAKAEANLEAVDAAPTSEDPAECVADKGYHSRAVLRALNDSPWKTRIAAPKQTGFSRWHGDEAARRAVTNNRARRAEIVERCFAHNLDRGGMRRTWLRGRENVHKRPKSRKRETTLTAICKTRQNASCSYWQTCPKRPCRISFTVSANGFMSGENKSSPQLWVYRCGNKSGRLRLKRPMLISHRKSVRN